MIELFNPQTDRYIDAILIFIFFQVFRVVLRKIAYTLVKKTSNKYDDYILDVDLSQTSVKDLFIIKNSLSVQLEQLERKTVTDPKVTTTNELGYKEQLKLNLYEID